MKGANIVRKTSPRVILLAVVGLVLVALAAYFVLMARPNSVAGRPTLVYFRLAT
jgi:hypothetical protein